MRQLARNKQAGFTIIELMLATTILSVILVMVTTIMINISDLYYKGVNQVKIQNSVRAVSDDLSQQLQLSEFARQQDLLGDHGEMAYCIGNYMYTYKLGIQVGNQDPLFPGADFRHILWRSDYSGGDCEALNLTTDTPITSSGSLTPGIAVPGSELIAPRSRLLHFEINTVSPYTIVLGMAYGDDDLLTTPITINTKCRGVDAGGDAQKGRQFCATAHLTTKVVRRL